MGRIYKNTKDAAEGYYRSGCNLDLKTNDEVQNAVLSFLAIHNLPYSWRHNLAIDLLLLLKSK